MDKVELDQHNVIFKSLESVINFDVNLSELKDFSYLSSDQLSSKCAFDPFSHFTKMVNQQLHVNKSKITVKSLYVIFFLNKITKLLM